MKITMQPGMPRPPWYATSTEGLIVPEYLTEPLLFHADGSSEPPGGPPWSEYGIWLWPHTLLMWPSGAEKPVAAYGFVILADHQPVLSRGARLWCATIIDFGEAVMLCGRTKDAVESGKRLVEPLVGGAGLA